MLGKRDINGPIKGEKKENWRKKTNDGETKMSHDGVLTNRGSLNAQNVPICFILHVQAYKTDGLVMLSFNAQYWG